MMGTGDKLPTLDPVAPPVIKVVSPSFLFYNPSFLRMTVDHRWELKAIRGEQTYFNKYAVLTD